MERRLSAIFAADNDQGTHPSGRHQINSAPLIFLKTGDGMSTTSRLAVLLFSFLFLPGYSFAAGRADVGKNLAVQLCATCHLVTEDQKSASIDVPTFSSIAAKYGQDIDYLAGFLADPHPPMPNFSLTRREIRDLLAYIKSLK